MLGGTDYQRFLSWKTRIGGPGDVQLVTGFYTSLTGRVQLSVWSNDHFS